MRKSKNIKALILDMDGVLWNGDQPIGNLAEIFEAIDNKGIKYLFATNNSTRDVAQFLKKLTSFGISVTKEQVITSAIATATYMSENYQPGSVIFIIGEVGLTTALENNGFKISEQGAEAVVVGLDTKFDYNKLRTASLIIRAGKPLIATNPDLTIPSADGLVPGAGSIIAAVEAATGVSAIVIGKPEATMFTQALNILKTNPNETLVVGDRLATDIAGGIAANCMTALVLSGVENQESANASNIIADIVTSNLESLVEML